MIVIITITIIARREILFPDRQIKLRIINENRKNRKNSLKDNKNIRNSVSTLDYEC